MIPRYILAWLVLMVIAVVNGTIREFTYGRYVNDLTAHQLSTIALMTLAAAFLWFMNRVWPIGSAAQAWGIGAVWLLMTVLFEFGFGHFVAGHSWAALLADYNFLAGRLWALFLVWILVLPWLVYRMSQDQVLGSVMKVRQRSLQLGIVAALVVALLGALVPTIIDWQNNPGHVFRGSEGTHWGAVVETAWTWFWPLFLLIVPVTVLAHAWYANRKRRDQG